MSWVTNLMVAHGLQDLDRAVEFNEWLTTAAPRREGGMDPGAGRLSLTTEHPADAWAGPKFPECHLWLGVLNHADVQAVVDRFVALAWRRPEDAQLFLKDQEQSFFQVWMIRNGRALRCTPDPPE